MMALSTKAFTHLHMQQRTNERNRYFPFSITHLQLVQSEQPTIVTYNRGKNLDRVRILYNA